MRQGLLGALVRLRRREAAVGDPTSQAVTAEWIVALIRPVGLAVFALIGWVRPPEHPVDLSLLFFFVLAGALYALYVLHLLAGGRVVAELPRYLTFFLLCDILLLTALSYVANVFHEGLLFFFHLLIIVVALRANFRLSLALAPIMIAAYYLGGLLVSGGTLFPRGVSSSRRRGSSRWRSPAAGSPSAARGPGSSSAT